MNRQRILILIGAFLLVLVATAWRALVGSGQPSGLGVQAGRLDPCPDSPNCVSTQSSGGYPQTEPLPMHVDGATTIALLREVVMEQPRMRVESQSVEIGGHYLWATDRSRWLRFVDDIEFFVDEAEAVVHFRSASRVGYSDLGVNQARMETIRNQYLARLNGEG